MDMVNVFYDPKMGSVKVDKPFYDKGRAQFETEIRILAFPENLIESIEIGKLVEGKFVSEYEKFPSEENKLFWQYPVSFEAEFCAKVNFAKADVLPDTDTAALPSTELEPEDWPDDDPWDEEDDIVDDDGDSDLDFDDFEDDEELSAFVAPVSQPINSSGQDDQGEHKMRNIMLILLAVVILAIAGTAVWASVDGSPEAATAATNTPTMTPTVSPSVTPSATVSTATSTSTPTPSPLIIYTPVSMLLSTTLPIPDRIWDVQEIHLEDDPIVEEWIRRLRIPEPDLWQTFPNVENSLVPEFESANGLEYAEDDSPFCEQDQRCDIVVPAQHYRLITGDYEFEGMTCSTTVNGQGCMLLLVNVMDQTYTWRDERVDNGFTVMGRYWNGNELDWAVWGIVSHASANMLNMRTFADSETGEILNSGDDGPNAGAGCGRAEGCDSVNIRVIVHAGDRILVILESVVNR
ncbi:MAG: Myb-like protein U [Candidatus Woesebacteria bacterium GW2011_GWC1_42_9]|nr:MAG: Myb-like protein U [Candidatus Woesebacteria bacterium GW2011_GWC1_42_9]